ncbi:acyltransferase-domain-containing protein [Hysterangium stoloniferum]|nr:acyltransferase-domain-containing protein [Hysterangium stoloniferum]
MTRKSLLSTLIISTAGLGSKAFLNFLTADVKVVGLPRLLHALDNIRDGKSRGVLTVSNHISVVDEPLMWGILPTSHFLCGRPARWSLGAADIIFTNPLFSRFFREVQVLETFRGRGIRQPAIDKSIELLNNGEWIHIFPEGKITQPPHSNLQRLKWGVGRMLMETNEIPTIIPIWLTGFDQVMSESRQFPRPIPRPGKRVSITIGESQQVEERIRQLLLSRKTHATELQEDQLRSVITAAIQESLEVLGATMSREVTEGLKEGKE